MMSINLMNVTQYIYIYTLTPPDPQCIQASLLCLTALPEQARLIHRQWPEAKGRSMVAVAILLSIAGKCSPPA